MAILISSAGPTGRVVDANLYLLLGVSILLFVGITAAMLVFAFKFHHTRHPKPTDVKANVWVEVVWTVLPTILVLFLFYYGVKGYDYLRNVPAGAMNVKVIARQWSWTFGYENGVGSPELRVPVGKPIKLSLASQDVIHSFFVPAFRIKQDVVPGMTTYLWFRADKPGEYDVLCTQYCGLKHSDMRAKIVAVPEAEFAAWYASRKQVVLAGTAEEGAQVFKEHGCDSCHSVDGMKSVGPTLKGLIGSTVTVTTDRRKRTLTSDEGYISRSIVDPDADIVEGFQSGIMPNEKDQLTDKELEALMKYIEGLK